MAFQIVMKNTFLNLEISSEESEFSVQQHRQRAHTDGAFEYSSRFTSTDLGHFKSTDLSSPESTSMGSSRACSSSGGSVAGDVSDRWADICDTDDDLPSQPTPSFSHITSPPLRPEGTWFSSLSPPVRPAGTWFLPQACGPAHSQKSNEQCAIGRDIRTALCVRNLPEGCTHKELHNILDGVGLAGLYNFVYIPFDFKRSALLRYGFVNFEQHEHAVKAIAILDGFADWDSEKSCEVDWGSVQQSLHENIERYRNSPLMHGSVPDEYKPVLFKGGVRIAFPAPTKAVKPMKIRKIQQS